MLMQTSDELSIATRKQGKVVPKESSYVAGMALKNLENLRFTVSSAGVHVF